MIHIIGGAKTGYNLYKYVRKLGIDADLYYFSGEYAEKKNTGKNFKDSWKGKDAYNHEDAILITSESAFNNLPESDKHYFEHHYFLRNKLNLPEISQKIKTSYIKEVSASSGLFPLALKPKESSAGKVPFKFRKVNTPEELKSVGEALRHCIVQPYFSESDYSQIAVAGFFDGSASSLIAVEQKNHYPKGISAYVIDRTNTYRQPIEHITKYLNELNYRGFIEFEFKKSKLDDEIYVMDINPRTWGWSYYYLNGLRNFKEVISEKVPAEVKLKKAWINLPRLMMAFAKGNTNTPAFADVIKQNICYEPYF